MKLTYSKTPNKNLTSKLWSHYRRWNPCREEGMDVLGNDRGGVCIEVYHDLAYLLEKAEDWGRQLVEVAVSRGYIKIVSQVFDKKITDVAMFRQGRAEPQF